MSTQKENRQSGRTALSEKARKYCAYAERCTWDVRQKLMRLGASGHDITDIIGELVEEGYLDDSRFAAFFATGKFRNNRWGKQKIRAELLKRGIKEQVIRQALATIDDEAYDNCLRWLIDKKNAGLDRKNARDAGTKIVAYCVQKGFEADHVIRLLDEMRQS